MRTSEPDQKFSVSQLKLRKNTDDDAESCGLVNILGVYLFKILKLKGSYRMDVNFVIQFLLWKFCEYF